MSMINISTNDVHIWTIPLTEWSSHESLFLLNSDEKQRAYRYRFEEHKRQFVNARAGLKRILSYYLALAPETIQLDYTAHAKPFLKSNALQFNLSHSDELALCAISQTMKLGIDIEKIKTLDYIGIANRFFSESENTALSTLPEDKQLNSFFQLWTSKEAVLKAMGTGLHLPLSYFSLPLQKKIHTLNIDNQHWSVYPLETSEKYCATLASSHNIHFLQYWELSKTSYECKKIMQLSF